jgi:O-methyltransferase
MSAVRNTVKRLTPAPMRHVIRQRVLDPLRGGGWRLVPEPELQEVFERALELTIGPSGRSEPGDYVEFGVCHGTSMACMARAADALGLPDLRLVGFDSFEGLPAGVEDEDLGVWRAGEYRSTERVARRNLAHAGVSKDRYVLVKGWFDDTATTETAARLGIEQVPVAMIDCDAYSSTVTALAFLAPMLADTAVLVFDDWHTADLAANGEGEKRAFDEWLDAHAEYEVVDELAAYNENSHVVVLTRG